MSTTTTKGTSSRGAFIVFEGLDRSGKSTQVKTLVDKLRASGIKARDARFPDRTTTTGKMIDSYLRNATELDDRSIHLLFSANRWELAEGILKDLREGTTIVCDRYGFSGIAFSAVKGLSYEWCQSPDVGLPQPDLVLFLDISPAAAAARGGYGGERYENSETQKRVREVFGRIEADFGGIGGNWRTVDAGGSLDEVGREIWEAVEQVVKSGEAGGLGEVGLLWKGKEKA
ncbi:thymidylate kinase [Pseudohyphozyma bogoriensis]|nr:thymidylate kinase [Pseudohyphozyma bogoriensis]